jgi:hypothetical protein
LTRWNGGVASAAPGPDLEDSRISDRGTRIGRERRQVLDRRATSPALATPALTSESAIASRVNSGITLASPSALILCSMRISGSEMPISRKYLASLRAQPGSPPLRARTSA